jgi:phasin family protein
MFLTSEQITAAQRASLGTLHGLTIKVFEGLERLSALNLQASRIHVADGANVALKTLSATTLQDLLAIRTETSSHAHAKLADYIRQLSEISGAAQLDFSAFVETVQADNAARVQAFFAKVAESPPAASESTVAMVKSAIHAAQTTYASVQQATKETAALAHIDLADAAAEAESTIPECSKA